MGNTSCQDSAAAAFISRWSDIAASELSTAQSFVSQLCDLLGVAVPHPTFDQSYMFERPVTFTHGDGSISAGRIDCYKRGHFCLESKKLRAGSHTKGFDDGLLRARSQAENYARALPASEGRPPFVLVVDVGTVIEVYAEFSKSGGTYTPFPDPRSHRIKLTDLALPAVRERLRQIWLAPDSLNPALISAKVTREVADLLARLAKSIETGAVAETGPVAAEIVASYLTRCLFSMFAEDVGLLPNGAFIGLLTTHRDEPATLQIMLHSLWADMDRGGFSPALAKKVLHFNGKLFKHSATDGYSLLLKPDQIDLLIEAAKANWRDVEPAIFGTLLERALDTTERHALGAHYTPRAYVERLVMPTVIEPLRAEWLNAQAAALVLAHEATELAANPPLAKGGTDFASFERKQLQDDQAALKRHESAVRAKWKESRQQVKNFYHRLCTLRVLDPACGSGNFLYVTLEHLKRLEGEVLNQLAALGDAQESITEGGETVNLQQLRGIELNSRAAALAELVLWIGYLQWHIRTQGNAAVAEPVVHDYGNIECRDAVLAWNALEPAYAADGQLLTRWDGETLKIHPVTGAKVPDETAQVPQWKYISARQAVWPQADFIVGNPPFIGAASMRAALGDGYVQALRGVWKDVPESADFVMYWWSHAAALVAGGQAQRMGLITTNSLRQTFNRRVVQAALEGHVEGLNPGTVGGSGAQSAGASGGAGAGYAGPLILSKAQKSVPGIPHPGAGRLSLLFAIADHPWVDNANGAAVRIAMTVAERAQRAIAFEVTWHSAMTGDAANVGSDPSPLGAGSDPNFAAGEVGRLLSVTDEQPGEHGEVNVTLAEQTGLIHADLTIGANVTSAVALRSNSGITSRGVMLFGAGFIVTPEESFTLDATLIRDYRNGRDLTERPRGVKVIDAFGLNAEQLRSKYPAVYQWLLDRVKPERDTNRDLQIRQNWWLHGRPRGEIRLALAGLPRYIATVETAKHRVFQFLDASILPDNKLIAIALSDAFYLGVLSSQAHGAWALGAGSWLGVGNDPVYVKTRCFETFPFPAEDTGLSPELRQKISQLAEQIDTHRKRVLGLLPLTSKGGAPIAPEALGPVLSAIPAAAQPQADEGSGSATQRKEPASVPVANNLTLTGIYNVLQALREGRPLTAKEKQIHSAGLVSVLKELHDELDAAVLQAYGWSDLIASTVSAYAALTRPAAQGEQVQTGSRLAQGEPSKDELLTRLVALNVRRSNEEAKGIIRWLRPDFQNPIKPLPKPTLPMQVQQALDVDFPLPNQSEIKPDKAPQDASNKIACDGVQPWPASLPGQVRAVAQVLGQNGPMTLAALESQFKGRGAWKKSLPILLQTLEALGRAWRVELEGVATWRA
jgi:hypothetical protein